VKQIFLYTVLKYVEFGATALLTLLLATRVTAEEYGAAAIFFVVVTYLQFASFGANQVLVKWYANRKDDKDGLVSINLMFWTTIIVCVLILVISLFYGSLMFFYASSVAILKLVYDAFINVFRVAEMLQRINMLSFLFSLIFLLTSYFFAFSVQTYFFSWIVSLVIAIAWGLFLLPSKVLRLRIFIENVILIRKFLSDGLILLLINFVTLSLTTVDRTILNLFHVPKAYVGSVQLVDTITNGVTLSVTSIMFVLLPRIYSMIRNAEIKLNLLYVRSIIGIALFLGLLLGSYFLILPLISPYIYKYPNFTLHFNLQLAAKAILLLTIIPYAYMVVNSREIQYLRIYASWVCLTLLAYLTICYLEQDKTLVTYYLNMTLLVSSIFVNLHLFWTMKKIYK
jgi:O-antigen/teichoic acid export membrane protein